MGAIQKAVKTEPQSQFELTTNIITKLNTFKLTPTAKLVLLYLTTCYNPKHNEVFPKQKTIADKLGISEVSVTRAISELHKEGLIFSERKTSNRYVFSSRIVRECPINLMDDKQQKDRNKNVNLIESHVHEQKKETKKEPAVKKYLTVDSNSIEFEEFEILKDYAIKYGAKNVNAYVNVLKQNGSATKILQDYKAKENAKKRALHSIEETQGLIISFQNMKYEYENPNNVSVWVELGKKINASKKQAF